MKPHRETTREEEDVLQNGWGLKKKTVILMPLFRGKLENQSFICLIKNKFSNTLEKYFLNMKVKVNPVRSGRKETKCQSCNSREDQVSNQECHQDKALISLPIGLFWVIYDNVNIVIDIKEQFFLNWPKISLTSPPLPSMKRDQHLLNQVLGRSALLIHDPH